MYVSAKIIWKTYTHKKKTAKWSFWKEWFDMDVIRYMSQAGLDILETAAEEIVSSIPVDKDSLMMSNARQII